MRNVLNKKSAKKNRQIPCRNLSILGRSAGTRTPGLLLPKQARYQLRNTPIFLYGPENGAYTPIIHIFFQMSNVQKINGDFFLQLEYNTHIILYWRNIS